MIGAQTIQNHMVNVKAFLDLYLPLRSQQSTLIQQYTHYILQRCWRVLNNILLHTITQINAMDPLLLQSQHVTTLNFHLTLQRDKGSRKKCSTKIIYLRSPLSVSSIGGTYCHTMQKFGVSKEAKFSIGGSDPVFE